ncbi:hypothetical protein BDW60DRAFT_211761 [Aspergillus nidulans var. acristatus]
MADITSKNLKEGEYYKLFFPKSVCGRENFKRDAKAVYGCIHNLLVGQVKGAYIIVSCNNTRPMCNKDGLCQLEMAAKNSDNWALIAAGVFFPKKAGQTIPLPELPELPEEPLGAIIKATCIQYNDYLPDLLEPAYRIDGYMAFGDSYSTGMGTGSILSGPCQVSSNNYP